MFPVDSSPVLPTVIEGACGSGRRGKPSLESAPSPSGLRSLTTERKRPCAGMPRPRKCTKRGFYFWRRGGGSSLRGSALPPAGIGVLPCTGVSLPLYGQDNFPFMGVEGKQTNENRKEKQDEGKVHNGEGLGASGPRAVLRGRPAARAHDVQARGIRIHRGEDGLHADCRPRGVHGSRERMKGRSLLIQVRQAKLGRTKSGRSYIVKKSTYD